MNSAALTQNKEPGLLPPSRSSRWRAACLCSGSLETCCRPPGPALEGVSWPDRWGRCLWRGTRAGAEAPLRRLSMHSFPRRRRHRSVGLASLTAFCRHRSEPSEDERLPVDAGHVPLQPCSPRVGGKRAGLKAETKQADNKCTRASVGKRLGRASSSPPSPPLLADGGSETTPICSSDWSLTFPRHAHCSFEACAHKRMQNGEICKFWLEVTTKLGQTVVIVHSN